MIGKNTGVVQSQHNFYGIPHTFNRTHSNQSYRQRYECKTCQKRFDDLTETYLEGHNHPIPDTP
jgi:transposase-like protein